MRCVAVAADVQLVLIWSSLLSTALLDLLPEVALFPVMVFMISCSSVLGEFTSAFLS